MKKLVKCIVRVFYLFMLTYSSLWALAPVETLVPTAFSQVQSSHAADLADQTASMPRLNSQSVSVETSPSLNLNSLKVSSELKSSALSSQTTRQVNPGFVRYLQIAAFKQYDDAMTTIAGLRPLIGSYQAYIKRKNGFNIIRVGPLMSLKETLALQIKLSRNGYQGTMIVMT
ncbi:Sporulation related domain protein [Piscirickettsia salmonis]|uniref:Sporulation related domain protein n=1 Tax=Piscirickettsia salmonis TaxID=1238 RepID=A0A1L6TEN9_PISSA|nr:SPOR domain-containing protein [Piscirickettsia salmonis]ALB23950.1 sporulation related domain protein [Piscirickettsia salmonis]ALT18693.1 sporulation protein [Piscirickettsia salmonis LF-89 = ATCC VR-1361]ALY03773.1 sporulation protein [Piscirickettsia salmonis]AMA43335.1 sporulation protein [Piscirickettsia salmonis]AOS35805.1 sporulation protein [Piscirickettsia salmonis]